MRVNRHRPNNFKKVATPCIDDHQLNPSDFEVVGKVKPHAAKIVLKCIYGARTNRMDLYWTVNTLARNVTKWTVADDKRLHNLMCYIEHTADWVLKAHVGDYPEDIRVIEFVDASFAGDLTDSKSTSASVHCLIGPRTFVPITWMCKKQGAVSHSSSEAEVIALEMAMRMEVLTGLQMWDAVIDVYDGKSAE